MTVDNLKTLQEGTVYGKEKKPLANVPAIMKMILRGMEVSNMIDTHE